MSRIRFVFVVVAMLGLLLGGCSQNPPVEESQASPATAVPAAPAGEAIEPPVVQPQPTGSVASATLPEWVAGAAGFSDSAESRKLDPNGGTFVLEIPVAINPETNDAARISFGYQPDGNGGLNLTHDLGVLMLDPSMLSNEIKLFLWSPTAEGPFLPLMAIYSNQNNSFVLVDGVYVFLADPVGKQENGRSRG